ncbi:PepSY-associated TM helix domain-containing protein [Paenibacillus sp. GCM10023250]|uniref:PepSY-associated TM helix domain-containing protein n=1 Tax=Paenibacillus sp. GCM10023250 TaxID=3252648 RepID=UPI00361D5097
MRKVVLRTHLLLSLLLGLFVVTTCTSGSIIMLEPELESWLYPVEEQPTEGDIGAEAIKAHADALNPAFETDVIEWPAKDGFYHVRISEDGENERVLYADPGTGRTFGNVREERSEPFETIYNLHRYFLMTNVIGKTHAAHLVGWIGVGLILILATGVWLWWPSIRKLALGFRLIRGRGRLAFNMSLHKVVGILSIPVLLVLAATGVVNAYEKQIPGWVGFQAKETVPDSAKKTAAVGTDAGILSVGQAVALVREQYPHSKLIKVTLPRKPGDTYQFGVREGFGASDGSNSTIYMDAASGNILYKTHPNWAINLYNAWRKGLHFATWGGLTTRLIAFAFGMMPLVLMITGLTVWRMKARARKRGKRRDAGRSAAA